MIHIIKSQEPDCLTELRESEGTNFNSLQGDCLITIRQLLASDQKGLCAYCQRLLKSTVFIEHYIPQSKDSSQELKYSNFLGVCSGKYYVDKKTGKHIEFCSCSRGNKDVSVNPIEEKSMATIFFDEYNRIRSTNRQIDIELNEIFNLNFSEICEDRNNSYSCFLKSVFEIGQKMNLSKVEIYTKALKSLQFQAKEFQGFILYRLSEAIGFQKNL